MKCNWVRSAVLFATASMSVCWTLQTTPKIPIGRTSQCQSTREDRVFHFSKIQMASAAKQAEPRFLASRRLYRWISRIPKTVKVEDEVSDSNLIKLIAFARLGTEGFNENAQSSAAGSGTHSIRTNRYNMSVGLLKCKRAILIFLW
jgi:hypothetical protein